MKTAFSLGLLARQTKQFDFYCEHLEILKDVSHYFRGIVKKAGIHKWKDQLTDMISFKKAFGNSKIQKLI